MPEPRARIDLALALSSAAATVLHKPETWVQTCILPGLTMTLGGSTERSALLEVSGIGGMDPALTRQASAALCQVLSDRIGMDPERIYVVFRDVPAHAWGWNGATFGD